jgi:DNA-binding response OmpR family regulator
MLELLREHGFQVSGACDGREALRMLSEYDVDLLFTDIVLPGISGFELARQTKLIHHNLRVLLMTGDHWQTTGKGIRFGWILVKPIRVDEILAEVNQALAS